MATIDGMKKARALASEAATIIGGAVNGAGRLILSNYGGGTIDAGNVRGPQGPEGVAPAGCSMPFMGPEDKIPDGWLLCDGSEVSRATYHKLFAAIGTYWGPGDYVNTFELPDMRNRVAVGKGDEDGFDEVGLTGGQSFVTLTVTEMPVHTHVQNSHNHTQNSHNHTQNSHNHTQNSHTHAPASRDFFLSMDATISNEAVGAIAGTGFSMLQTTGAGSGNATTASTTAVNVATTATNTATTATNQDTGGGAPHDNRQQFGVVHYIIKT